MSLKSEEIGMMIVKNGDREEIISYTLVSTFPLILHGLTILMQYVKNTKTDTITV